MITKKQNGSYLLSEKGHERTLAYLGFVVDESTEAD